MSKTVEEILSEITLPILEQQKTVEKEIQIEIENPDSTRIIIWNINGFRSFIKKNNLKQLVESRKIDIICFYELKVDREAFKKLNLKKELEFLNMKYKYYNFSQRKGYAGISVFSRIKPKKVIKNFKTIHDKESRLLALEFEKFFLISVYVPCSGENIKRLDYRLEWDEDVLKFILNLKSKKKVLYIGDLNVAHHNIDIHNPLTHKRSPSFTIEERTNFQDLLKTGFKDAFRALHPKKQKFSYWNYRFNSRARGKGWRVDYFLVDENLWNFVLNCDILDKVKGSDHCPLELVMKNDIWSEEEMKMKNGGFCEDSYKSLSDFEFKVKEKKSCRYKKGKNLKKILDLKKKGFLNNLCEEEMKEVSIKVEYDGGQEIVIKKKTKLRKEILTEILNDLF